MRTWEKTVFPWTWSAEFEPAPVHAEGDEAREGEPVAQGLAHPAANTALTSSRKRGVHFRNIFMKA